MKKIPFSVLMSTEAVVLVFSIFYIFSPETVSTEQLLDLLALFAVGLACRLFVLRFIVDNYGRSYVAQPKNSRLEKFLYIAVNATFLGMLFITMGSQKTIDVLLFQNPISLFVVMIFVSINTFLYHYLESAVKERIAILISNLLKFGVLILVAYDLLERLVSIYLIDYKKILPGASGKLELSTSDISTLVLWFGFFLLLDLILWGYFQFIDSKPSSKDSRTSSQSKDKFTQQRQNPTIN